MSAYQQNDPIRCITCKTEYPTDDHFRRAHKGPHVEEALRAARMFGVKLVNCPNCPLPAIAKARPKQP